MYYNTLCPPYSLCGIRVVRKGSWKKREVGKSDIKLERIRGDSGFYCGWINSFTICHSIMNGDSNVGDIVMLVTSLCW